MHVVFLQLVKVIARRFHMSMVNSVVKPHTKHNHTNLMHETRQTATTKNGQSTRNPSIILMPARTNLVGRGHEQ
jgi:hypothetical protein